MYAYAKILNAKKYLILKENIISLLSVSAMPIDYIDIDMNCCLFYATVNYCELWLLSRTRAST